MSLQKKYPCTKAKPPSRYRKEFSLSCAHGSKHICLVVALFCIGTVILYYRRNNKFNNNKLQKSADETYTLVKNMYPGEYLSVCEFESWLHVCTRTV